jgi:hypothetical protein
MRSHSATVYGSARRILGHRLSRVVYHLRRASLPVLRATFPVGRLAVH